MKRIYLDNAATSWPKPKSVYDSVDRYQRELGVAAGRGSYRASEEVTRTLTQTRLNISKIIGAGHASPNQCIFTQNCTDALNLALHGLLNDDDHVVTTAAEHNSILRPLAMLRRTKNVSHTTVAVDSSGVVDVDAIAKAIQPRTRLVAIGQASNVTGALQPIQRIAVIAKEYECLVLLDAAQTIGHTPINVSDMHIDLLAAPGHKGLMGPLGTGFLYIRENLEAEIRTQRQGGTGTQSELPDQPTVLPFKYESGNFNVPGIFGLNAGTQYVLDQELPASTKLTDLTHRIASDFESITGITVYSKPNVCGIVSFNVDGYDPREVATLLDSSAGIEVRAGLHCAPLMHRVLGTFEIGGTVRASCGHFSTAEEIDTLVDAVRMLAESSI